MNDIKVGDVFVITNGMTMVCRFTGIRYKRLCPNVNRRYVCTDVLGFGGDIILVYYKSPGSFWCRCSNCKPYYISWSNGNRINYSSIRVVERGLSIDRDKKLNKILYE